MNKKALSIPIEILIIIIIAIIALILILVFVTGQWGTLTGGFGELAGGATENATSYIGGTLPSLGEGSSDSNSGDDSNS